MKRRTVLGSMGSLVSIGTIGTIGYASRGPADRVEIRFWLSDRAADYDVVPDRVRSYLELAFGFEFWTADVSFGGVVPVSTEDGYEVTMGGEWPATLLAGSAGDGVSPGSDVNLLVTDGQMQTGPTGAGFPHVASVGGARYVANVPPVDDRPSVVPYARPDRVMQTLVHEVGHALGLRHRHGTTFSTADGVVATPMLGAYAWDQNYDGSSQCGRVDPSDGARLLTYSFSGCARERLRSYRGGLRL